MLKLNEQASMATLTFVNDNVLRINTVNDVTPTLEYRLTRQADIDAIDELAGKTPLKRSEEHTSELQSLMRISYAVFCLKIKKKTKPNRRTNHTTSQVRAP